MPMTRGCESSGWSAGGGSTAHASKPAPDRCPDSSASNSASSCGMPPRAVFTRIAPSGISAYSFAPSMPSVSLFSGQWTLTMSLCARSAVSSVFFAPRSAQVSSSR
ncbi:MAG: hypothetical protein O2822_00735 [Chloroflexi bacterium]|nr:hypothetical protein [Chloroflexota bacterium]